MLKRLVCPICYRSNCRLFIRMSDLKFTREEKRKFFRAFHRDVCGQCRRLCCKSGGFCQEKIIDTKRHTLPEWWS